MAKQKKDPKTNVKIWGIRGGGMGDLMQASPILNYMEKKYPGSYKYYVINRKCAQAAPVFLNHPLIDNVHVLEEWETLGPNDIKLRDSCDIIFDVNPPFRDKEWYNEMNAVDQAARMAGIDDLDDVLSPEEKIPVLTKWWLNPEATKDVRNNGYRQIEYDTKTPTKKVGIFPFAMYNASNHTYDDAADNRQRNPNLPWWEVVCELLSTDLGYEVRHFGWWDEPDIRFTDRYTHDSYFEQIKLACECDVLIGTDTGTMWFPGALGIPSIHLMTYWAPNHRSNPTAFEPVNKNGKLMFNENSCSRIKPMAVVDYVQSIIEKK